VAAFALARLPLDSLPDVRRHPETALGISLPVSVLKHLDDQTVAGLAAVCRALKESELNQTGFHDWGVLAAPHFIGQTLMVTSLQRFHEEGAWGVSPHVIPHHSLHSLSGTISQVLKIHGPNLGVGGGRGGTGEALLAAAAWIGRQRVPGVWVVVTSYDPQGELDSDGHPQPGTASLGLALALQPARADSYGLRLRFLPGDDARRTDRPVDLLRMNTALEIGRSSRGAGGMVVSAVAPRIELEWGRPGRLIPSHGYLLKAADTYPAAAHISTGAETKR
jgi:hypothetical protein